MGPTATLAPRRTLLHAAILLVAAKGEEGSNRRRVYALVQEHPGLHQREIARRLDLHANTAEHHLRHLTRAGLLSTGQDGGYMRYYPTREAVQVDAGRAVDARDRDKLALLRQARPLEIVAHLLVEGRMAMGDLAEAIGISQGTLTYQVKKLEKADLVRRERVGNQRLVDLVDRDDTARILLAHEPPADLVAGFESLWEDVGL